MEELKILKQEQEELFLQKRKIVSLMLENSNKQKRITEAIKMEELGFAFGDIVTLESSFLSNAIQRVGMFCYFEFDSNNCPKTAIFKKIKQNGKPGERIFRVWLRENFSIKKVEKQ